MTVISVFHFCFSSPTDICNIYRNGSISSCANNSWYVSDFSCSYLNQQNVNSNGNEQTRIRQCFLRTMYETLSQMYVAFDKKTIELWKLHIVCLTIKRIYIYAKKITGRDELAYKLQKMWIWIINLYRVNLWHPHFVFGITSFS